MTRDPSSWMSSISTTAQAPTPPSTSGAAAAITVTESNSNTNPDCCCAPQYMASSCCGPKPCRFCCPFCPPMKESRSTKWIYALTLFLSTCLMAATTFPIVQRFLQMAFRDFEATCTDLGIGYHDCMKLTGYMASYKISFSFFLFFITLSIITVRIRSSKGARACIHNGFWFFKLLIVSSVLVAIFVVPISHMHQLHSAWICVSLVGNGFFILIQLACLVHFTNDICQYLQRMRPKRIGRLLQLMLSLSVLSLWLVLSIALFLIHGRQEYCLTKQFSLIFNTGLSICIILAALTPCARKVKLLSQTDNNQQHDKNNVEIEHDDNEESNDDRISMARIAFAYAAQLTQAGLVVIYMTFWIWSAMQSTPSRVAGIIEKIFLLGEDDQLYCPSPDNMFVQESLTYTALVMMFFTIAYLGSNCNKDTNRPSTDANVKADNKNQHGFILRTTYSETAMVHICSSSTPSANDHRHGNNNSSSSAAVAIDYSTGGQHIIRNELIRTTYNYSRLHLTLALATVFACSQVTRWFQPPDVYGIHQELDQNWTTVNLKLATSWICGISYMLYLLLPEGMFKLPKLNEDAAEYQNQVKDRNWKKVFCCCSQSYETGEEHCPTVSSAEIHIRSSSSHVMLTHM